MLDNTPTNDNELHQVICNNFKIDYFQEMDVIVNPFDTFGSTALPIGTHLNYHWERCAPINTTLTSEDLVIQNGFVGQHMK